MQITDILINGIGFVIVIVSIVFHEVAHGYMAYRCGDATAKENGRLTLNPLKHIDPVGTIILPFVLKFVGSPVVLGWAKPVPVDYSRLNNPERDMVKVALAGPLTNLAIALSIVVLINLAGLAVKFYPVPWLGFLVYVIIKAGIWVLIVNIYLAVFNMIPIPPLDGSRLLRFFLPLRIRYHFDRLERYGILILFAFLYFGDGFWRIVDKFLIAMLQYIIFF